METLKADVLELLSGAGFYTSTGGSYQWWSGSTTDYGFSANYQVGSIPPTTSTTTGAFFIYDKNGKIIGVA